MNILITGINGFVGRNCVRQLSEKFRIYGVDICRDIYPGVIKTYLWNELEEMRTTLSIDIIIHLAGKAHDVKNKADIQEYFYVNTQLTQIIYDFFLQSSAKKFIFFSSVKAAADFVSDGILTEDVIPSPKGPYGESKIKAEEYILNKLPVIDKQVYILRPSMIHGPGNKGNLNLLYALVNKGIPWPLGSFENKRSFTSIDNVCYILENIIIRDIPTGIYNVSDDEALSTNELITIMCNAMGKKVNIWNINEQIMKILALMGTFLYLPLNKERLDKLTENYVVSNEKIKKALCVESLPVNASEGLTKTIRSFQK